MKIIDLLNRIANGKEIPKEIFYEDRQWYWEEKAQDYIYDYKRLFNYYLNEDLITSLNDEIEIIEEDKKIEKLYEISNIGDLTIKYPDNKQLMDKINEIIDVINRGD